MDRLTTLIEKFHLTVQPATIGTANLIALSDENADPSEVQFYTRGRSEADPDQRLMFAAHVDWGGPTNPLIAALPDRVDYDLTLQDDTRSLVALMHAEANGGRCGAQSVLSRLGEALVVRLLRAQMRAGRTQVGLLAGLADARLSRAIVAMHDHPGRLWTNADLADIAGLSLSRFSELFTKVVGETPMGYLRRWRLILAHQDVRRGDRIDAVARRYAYATPESFTRAFRKTHGVAPTALRSV
ncbi:MAG: AraC family transcriptional regulator [Shimia sp.]|jgi:AraC-like DNA-binding protein|uniref:AraC family transcriptional regulator n=1 Tax=Shimia sp. TaxID=1954381 RepID=UPI004059C379